MTKEIDDLKKAIELAEVGAEELKKSQMNFDFTASPTEPHHLAHTRTNSDVGHQKESGVRQAEAITLPKSERGHKAYTRISINGVISHIPAKEGQLLDNNLSHKFIPGDLVEDDAGRRGKARRNATILSTDDGFNYRIKYHDTGRTATRNGQYLIGKHGQENMQLHDPSLIER